MAPTKLNVSFKGLDWNETPVEPGVNHVFEKHTLATTHREFVGPDMAGKAFASYIMVHNDCRDGKPGGGYFEGQWFFDGTILGRKGSFIGRATGSLDGADVHCKWTILSDTATGELKGIKGTGGYDIVGEFKGGPINGELTVEFP